MYRPNRAGDREREEGVIFSFMILCIDVDYDGDDRAVICGGGWLYRRACGRALVIEARVE